MTGQVIQGRVMECRYESTGISPQLTPNGYVVVSLTEGRGKTAQRNTVLFTGTRVPPIQNGDYVHAEATVQRARVGSVDRDVLVVDNARIHDRSLKGRTLAEYAI